MKGGSDFDSGTILGFVGFAAVMLMFFVIMLQMSGGINRFQYFDRDHRMDTSRIRRLHRMRNRLLDDDYY